MLSSLISDPTEEEPSWELGLGSLTDEISSIEHQRLTEQHAALHQRLEQQRLALLHDTTGLTPLPHQDEFGSTFHKVVMEQYNRLGNLGLTPKEKFVSRKIKQKQTRAAKKAEDVFEKQTNKMSKGRQKVKAKKRATY
jgi:hypothetical protein